jgi:hypothetical protein
MDEIDDRKGFSEVLDEKMTACSSEGDYSLSERKNQMNFLKQSSMPKVCPDGSLIEGMLYCYQAGPRGPRRNSTLGPFCLQFITYMDLLRPLIFVFLT